MHIITISRQFGSGGRELGKRLADHLEWDYYDKEIIETLADEHGLDEAYVKHMLSNHGWHNLQLTYRNSFAHLTFDPGLKTQLLVRTREILREIAEAGSNCVIVGRDADVILQEFHPFRICVCAELSSRLERCMKYENKKPEDQRLTEKMVLRNIRRIDRNRTRTREILTGKAHGDGSTFDLTINASSWDLKKLVPATAEFARQWFEQ